MDTLKEFTLTTNEIDICKLHQFLNMWDENYKKRINRINLFNQNLIRAWDDTQKKLFVKLLYHQRAHFGEVLWYMGNIAPSYAAKEMILENIRDEFGKHGISHEELYHVFAKNMGVDLTYELVEEKIYPTFIKEYNKGHLRWLREHDWEHNLAAFAALERLDNLDYVSLRDVAIALGASKKALVFFNVHIHVTHYEDIEKSIFSELWLTRPEVVMDVFNFIGNYQIDIWKKISDAIFLPKTVELYPIC